MSNKKTFEKLNHVENLMQYCLNNKDYLHQAFENNIFSKEHLAYLNMMLELFKTEIDELKKNHIKFTIMETNPENIKKCQSVVYQNVVSETIPSEYLKKMRESFLKKIIDPVQDILDQSIHNQIQGFNVNCISYNPETETTKIENVTKSFYKNIKKRKNNKYDKQK